jgi:glyoxylase-like metal-dependent hydrolase (beta-lactamase superfamily II)
MAQPVAGSAGAEGSPAACHPGGDVLEQGGPALQPVESLQSPTADEVLSAVRRAGVNTGSKLVLIDSGAEPLYGACCGHLLENLRASGYRPEQVNEVLLTHLHADHVGGIANRGLPERVVKVKQARCRLLLNDANEKAAHDFLRPMFEGDKASMKPYVAAGSYPPFEGEQEMVPGIRAISTPGHTPGYTSYEVESRGQKLLVWGAVVHVAAIQFPDPCVSVTCDNEENRAEATREPSPPTRRRTATRSAPRTFPFPVSVMLAREVTGVCGCLPNIRRACPQLP